MVRPKRFELLAYRFVACCSIQLSYERMRSLLVETPFSVKKKYAQGNDVFLKNRSCTIPRQGRICFASAGILSSRAVCAEIRSKMRWNRCGRGRLRAFSV